MKKSYKTIGIIILIGILGIYFFISYNNGGKNQLNKNNNESIFVEEEVNLTEVNLKDETIIVEIKGEVKNPNVYYLEGNSIVEDLIKAAGGLTSEANINNINRAKELVNHECIIIPNINSVESENIIEGSTVINSGNKEDGLININTADEKELQELPGVGPSKAASIISYREENGKFTSIEDIKNVSGIGEASFNKIKEKITI